MKLSVCIILFFTLISSCTPEYGDPVAKPSAILKDFNTFWIYYNSKDLNLSEDFIALDPASNVISKETFLNLMSSGEYLPLRLISKDNAWCYQLYKLEPYVASDIRETIKYAAQLEYAHYKMEGTELPEFSFTDIEGNTYNKETTRGEIVVLKCWFINCKPCIEEMPALNEITKQYNNRKDILFVSLALDQKEDLKSFLKKTTFNYAVVPDQQAYLSALKINSYPTHILINKQGLIVKVTEDYKKISSALNKEAL